MSYAGAFGQSGEPSAMVAAVAWIEGALLGTLAVGLCVIAVAVVGFLTLQGRLPLRLGARVILGCFVLLGAPVIASAFLEFSQVEQGSTASAVEGEHRLPPREELDAAEFDPYAGASLRRD